MVLQLTPQMGISSAEGPTLIIDLLLYFNVRKEMSTSQKWNEKVDKENTKIGPTASAKKDKTGQEEPPKKKVLG